MKRKNDAHSDDKQDDKDWKEDDDDSHDEDGCGDERGRVETPLTVDVLSLSLVHLPSAVVTASTHTETQAYDGGEDHEHDTDGRTYEETGLVVDPLQEERIHTITIRPHIVILGIL